MGHQAEGQAVAGRNRAKLRNFEEQNRLYDREVMLDRAQYRNDMALEDIKQDDVYKAMVNQWTQEDQKLNRLFAESDQKIEKAVIEMYENEYAGTQTGRTAARLAGKSAKKLGQQNLNNFEKAGFDVLRISQNKYYRKMEKILFIELGLPQNNWLALVGVAPMRVAKNLKIKMIILLYIFLARIK